MSKEPNIRTKRVCLLSRIKRNKRLLSSIRQTMKGGEK